MERDGGVVWAPGTVKLMRPEELSPLESPAAAARRGVGAAVALPAMDSDQRFLNRDLSWLEFNRRVLAQALDGRSPLLTRVRFLSIFSSNLDEFFMKRVGYLRRQAELGSGAMGPDGLSPQQVLFGVRTMVLGLLREQAECFEQDILPKLAASHVHLVRHAELSADERRAVDRWFHAAVFPVLTPLAVDPGHRFPFISNLSENIGVMVSPPGSSERSFARVKIPDVLPRMIAISSVMGTGTGTAAGAGDVRFQGVPSATTPARFISLEEVIRNNLESLFPGMQVHDVLAFRVTRNAAVEVEEDADQDVLQSVENELRMRRFARAVRIEVGLRCESPVLELVASALRLDPSDIYEHGGPLEYGDLAAIADLDLPELREERWVPVVPPRLSGDVCETDADVFRAIRERDILLHHPYESFKDSVERFIAAAARDPDVLAIKQTIYRTSPDSPFIASLIRAAEEGKQVAVLVELRARFDESKNVRFARQLERAGVHVAYGVVGYKTHCKTSLVVRRETDEQGRSVLRSYAHVGTGNYNPSTAQLYTDLGLLTADPAITDDVANLFNFLTGRSLKKDYQQLLVAPFVMRERYNALIDREIEIAKKGPPGVARIIAKMNQMEDKKIAEKLYEASRAGVQVTLIVRGFCCLRPSVAGLSENIRVLSVVGRYLEHSRIFHFSGGHADPLAGEWYISSADWMYRNLSARVEAAVPIREAGAKRRLARIIEVMLADGRNAWELRPDGRYVPREPAPGSDRESPAVVGTFRALRREQGG